MSLQLRNQLSAAIQQRNEIEKKYLKYKKKPANNLNKIINLNKFVRLKMKSLSV